MGVFGISDLIVPLTLISMAVTAFVHIGFAVQVGRDATRLESEGRLIFGPTALWVLATLVGGALVAVGYWLIQHALPPRE